MPASPEEEVQAAGSRSLSPVSVLSSLSQGSVASPDCHPQLCCSSWALGAPAGPSWMSLALSASLSDVHSLPEQGELSPSRPEATLLAICLTSTTQKNPKLLQLHKKNPNYHFTPRDLDLQSIPCVSLCLQRGNLENLHLEMQRLELAAPQPLL